MAAADEGRAGGLQNGSRSYRVGGEVGCGSRRHDGRRKTGQADATGDDYEAKGRGVRADVMAGAA